MNPKCGQLWIRRLPFGVELNDIDDDMIHVTLASLGNGRFISITAGGEIHVWSIDTPSPDWKVWESIDKENE